MQPPRAKQPSDRSRAAGRPAARLRAAERPHPGETSKRRRHAGARPRCASGTSRACERLALHLLRDPEDARDAAQESLAKLCIADQAVPRRVAVLDLAAPADVVNTCKDVAQRSASAGEPLDEDTRVARDGDPAPRGRGARAARRALRGARGAQRRPGAGGRAEGRASTSRSRRSRTRPACPSAPRSATPTAARAGCASGWSRRAHELRRALRPRGDRADPPAPRSVPADRRGARARARASGWSRGRRSTEEDCAGHFPGNPIMPGVKMVEALAQCGAVAVLSQPENRGKLALFAGIDDVRFKRIVRPGRRADARVRRSRPCAARSAAARCARRSSGELAVRGTLTFAVERVIGTRAAARRGLDHRARLPRARAGGDERRARARSSTPPTSGSSRAPGSASGASRPTTRRCPTSRCRPRAQALEQAGRRRGDVDLIIVATVTPDMAFPSTARARSPTSSARTTRPPTTSRPAAPASCTRSRRPTGCSPRGLVEHALVVGGDVLSKILDWSDRSTVVLFGDGAGAVVLEPRRAAAASSASSSAPTAPAACTSSCRAAARARSTRRGAGIVKMNGREVFKFADPRARLVGGEVLDECGQDRRRRRRLRPAPGERAHHRPRGEEARDPGGEGRDQRRPLRQHVVGLDPARARGRRRRRAARSRERSC